MATGSGTPKPIYSKAQLELKSKLEGVGVPEDIIAIFINPHLLCEIKAPDFIHHKDFEPLTIIGHIMRKGPAIITNIPWEAESTIPVDHRGAFTNMDLTSQVIFLITLFLTRGDRISTILETSGSELKHVLNIMVAHFELKEIGSGTGLAYNVPTLKRIAVAFAPLTIYLFVNIPTVPSVIPEFIGTVKAPRALRSTLIGLIMTSLSVSERDPRSVAYYNIMILWKTVFPTKTFDPVRTETLVQQDWDSTIPFSHASKRMYCQDMGLITEEDKWSEEAKAYVNAVEKELLSLEPGLQPSWLRNP